MAAAFNEPAPVGDVPPPTVFGASPAPRRLSSTERDIVATPPGANQPAGRGAQCTLTEVPATSTLFVGNLAWSTTAEALKSYFSTVFADHMHARARV